MSNNTTKRDVTSHDNMTTFNVKCRNVAHAQRIIELLHTNDVETFVYRAQYDAERANIVNTYKRMLHDIAIAQIKSRNDDDNNVVDAMKRDVIAYARDNNITM